MRESERERGKEEKERERERVGEGWRKRGGRDGVRDLSGRLWHGIDGDICKSGYSGPLSLSI